MVDDENRTKGKKETCFTLFAAGLNFKGCPIIHHRDSSLFQIRKFPFRVASKNFPTSRQTSQTVTHKSAPSQDLVPMIPAMVDSMKVIMMGKP